ncbi:MAG: murein biosynthesis integral membrane protein MurJ [Candidatus Dependentiae bacterium]
MKNALSKQSIIKKTIQVGGSTLGSRFLGIIREVLMVRYLGAGAGADAFITAWKIPNSLRKIFAEGALSAAFIPTLVKLVKDGKKEDANGLMSMAFLVFEGIVLALCALIIVKAPLVVWFMAPGFSSEQIASTVPYLRILMPFIFFISSSALLAGALQAVNHFFVPAFSPILLNIVFISSLIICLSNQFPVEYLCFFILCGGLLQFLWHVVTFLKLHFSFGAITESVKSIFGGVFLKFCNCLVSMSVMEVSLIIDTQFASLLPAGSVAMLYYANRFMGIPLGVFVTAFSTILLPHFSRVVTYAPKRLSFYLLEAAKLIFWVTVPVTFLMIFFAEDIFATIFLSDKFPIEKVQQASIVLIAFISGLFFFSLNRILLNLYYALHNTRVPAVVSVIATLVNVGLNFLFIHTLKAPGLALATVVSAMIQTGLYALYLYKYMHFTFYCAEFAKFIGRYSMQLLITGSLFLITYYTLHKAILIMLPSSVAYFFLHKIGFWLWVGPLCLVAFAALYSFRKFFRVRVYFLD